MFKLTRYFSIASLIGMTIVVASLSWFYHHLSYRTIVKHGAGENQVLTTIFANSVWDTVHPYLQKASNMTRDELLSLAQTEALLEQLTQKIRGTPVVKVKIYNRDGVTVFSTDPAQIGEHHSDNPGVKGALAGQIIDEIAYRNEIDSFHGTLSHRNLISSYTPIRSASTGEVEAVFEIYSDITELLTDLRLSTWQILAAAMVSLTVLYILLYLIVRRADRIIRHHDSEREASEARMRYQAYHDPLTDLPNRISFTERLAEIVKATDRGGRLFAVMFIDLDRFKLINDGLGHDAGDHLLRVVAQRISSCVREADQVFRMGGDEFTVVLNTLERPESAAFVARRIIEALSEPIRVYDHELIVGASIGITISPTDSNVPERLVKNADTAMYTAKENGGRRYEFFTKKMNIIANERLEMESALQKAVREGEFELFYQPRIDTATGTTVAMEALLRWHHPRDGLVEPARFISLLEETGLIIPVGEWVLREACRQLKVWHGDGMNRLRISVNISSRQFSAGTLVDDVAAVLADTGLPPQSLELEVTETLLVDNAEVALETLTRLKEIGVCLSIDDFGSGYSSLNYLKQFPVDYLKIDRHFVVDSEYDEKGAAIATAITMLAESLRIKVVAEGVENQRQFDFMTAHYCDEMQGFLFSRPRPAREIKAWLTSQASAKVLVLK
jgi:diguanylate cyclase (GGDEF)-like protein